LPTSATASSTLPDVEGVAAVIQPPTCTNHFSAPAALDLGRLAHLGLVEDRQEHDAAAGSDPVGDALRAVAEVEAELAELATEVATVGSARTRKKRVIRPYDF
jgi:hypothetical protein